MTLGQFTFYSKANFHLVLGLAVSYKSSKLLGHKTAAGAVKCPNKAKLGQIHELAPLPKPIRIVGYTILRTKSNKTTMLKLASLLGERQYKVFTQQSLPLCYAQS